MFPVIYHRRFSWSTRRRRRRSTDTLPARHGRRAGRSGPPDGYGPFWTEKLYRPSEPIAEAKRQAYENNPTGIQEKGRTEVVTSHREEEPDRTWRRGQVAAATCRVAGYSCQQSPGRAAPASDLGGVASTVGARRDPTPFVG